MHVSTVCILGGTGFIGSRLVVALHDMGKKVRVLTRRRERHKNLLVLPRVEVVQCDIHDPAALAQQLQGMDAVVNLVGILNERRGMSFRKVHVELTQHLLQAALDCGTRRLLHMSSLQADAGLGSSLYLRSKGEAENHAHTFGGSRIAVTSFRPSVVFGPGDGLFNRFASLLRVAPVMPLACPDARMAPVYVGDLIDVMAGSLESETSIGQHIDLCGPDVLSLRELVKYTADVIGSRALIVGLPDWASRLQAAVLQYAPGKPFTRDNYDSLQTDSVCEDAEPQPTSIDSVVPGYLLGRSPYARFQGWRRHANR